jgi:hypothetical protein
MLTLESDQDNVQDAHLPVREHSVKWHRLNIFTESSKLSLIGIRKAKWTSPVPEY